MLFIINVGLILPLSLLRNLGALRYAALIAIIVLSFITLVTLIELPMYAIEHKFENVVYVNVNIHFFDAVNLSVFTYF
jgi:hypothetical protein